MHGRKISMEPSQFAHTFSWCPDQEEDITGELRMRVQSVTNGEPNVLLSHNAYHTLDSIKTAKESSHCVCIKVV